MHQLRFLLLAFCPCVRHDQITLREKDFEYQKHIYLTFLIGKTVMQGDIEGLKRVFASKACQSSWKHPKPYPDYALSSAVNVSGNGNVEIARFLITEYKLDVNRKHESSAEPYLWSAVLNENKAMVYFLINEAKADPHVTDHEGVTTIMMAAFKGLLDMVRMLALDFGVDLRAEDNKGCDVVYYVAKGGNVGVLSFLVDEMGLEIGRKYDGRGLLRVAAEFGHLEVTRWLVEEKGAENELTWCDNTPLHYAARGGHLDILQYYILERGVPVETKTNKRRTVLHEAAGKGHLALIKWLVEAAGADINACDMDDFQPQDLAAKARLGPIVKYGRQGR